MYYDRRPSFEVAALIAPDGPLAWLVEWAQQTPGAHIQYRRAEGERSRGSVQLYLGRTSPLEVIGASQNRLKLKASAAYVDDPRNEGRDLFKNAVTAADLSSLRPLFEAHLKYVRSFAGRSFTEGEAVAHAGMLRRYGPEGREGDSFTALDSEVTIGFASRKEQEKFNESQSAAHRELDVLGVLGDGSVALVELKAEGGDLEEAIAQVNVHVARFTKLTEVNADWIDALAGLAKAKHAAKLIRQVPHIQVPPQFVPVIAAPDAREDWAERWRQSARNTAIPPGLRLWRLSSDGCILDEERM